MLTATRKILQNFGRQSVKQMKANAAPYSASGDTVRGFRYETDEDGLRIYGVNYLKWAEYGRGETGASAKPSIPTLKERIKVWIAQKGLPLWKTPSGKLMTRDTMAFLIARKIHREGTKLYREGGERLIVSNVINETSVSNIVDSITETEFLSAASDIASVLLFFKNNKPR